MTLTLSQMIEGLAPARVVRRPDGDISVGAFRNDSRAVEPGDVFVALTDQRDGHDFVAQALQNGAAAALVTHVPDGVAADAPLLIVPDVLEGLDLLRRKWCSEPSVHGGKKTRPV